MADMLAMIRGKWGSTENCVIALGFLDADGIKRLRRNLIVDGTAIDWQAHAKLVEKAVEEADKLVDTIQHHGST